MLTYVKGSRNEVYPRLIEREAYAIGPTSATNWTSAWFPDDIDFRMSNMQIFIDVDDDYDAISVRVCDGEKSEEFEWIHETDPESSEELPLDMMHKASATATLLAEVLGHPDTANELFGAMRDEAKPREFLDRIRELGDLPVDVPLIKKAMVLTRASRNSMAFTAAVAATGFGRIALADLGEGWVALTPVDAPDRDLNFTRYVTEWMSRRRVGLRGRSALVVGRGPGGAAVALAIRKGWDIGSVDWNLDWDYPEEDHWSARDEAAEGIATTARTGDLDVKILRPLIRQKHWDGDPLAELLGKLGHDQGILALLDDPARYPGVQIVEAAGRRQVLWGLWTGRDIPEGAAREALMVETASSAFWALVSLVIGMVAIWSIVTGTGLDGDGPDFIVWVWAFIGPGAAFVWGFDAWGAWREARNRAGERRKSADF